MKTILITGCSSGYGLETARHFHAGGWTVIATMRNLPRPEAESLAAEAAKGNLDLHIVEIDVTDDASVAAGTAKALELADYAARRHKPSIGAIKRAVYFGSSLPLQDGIKLEAKEFLTLDVSPEGQKLMLAYQAGTDLLGDLPLYVAGQYETALEDGRTAKSYS